MVSLLERQHALEKVYIDVEDKDAILTLCVILTCGCLRKVRELTVNIYVDDLVDSAHMACLAGTLRAPGLLEKLEVLHLVDEWGKRVPPAILGSLASGAAPTLRVLDLNVIPYLDEEDVKAVTAVL